jgi:predicted PurR-regulated permease PerM
LAAPKDLAASSKSLMLIATLLVIATLYYGRQLLIPVALGLVFSFLLTPLVSLLEKAHMGRVASVLIVVALSLGLLCTVSWKVAGQLVEIAANFSDYKDNIDFKVESLRVSKDGNLSKASATVTELNKELGAVSGKIAAAPGADKTQRPVRPIPVQVAAPATNLLQDLRSLLGPLAGVLGTAAVVVILAVFMLLKREDLRNRAIRLAGRGQLTRMTQALDDAGRRLSKYLLLQFAVNAGYGLIFGGALYFIQVPHALLWGTLAALLRFIPYVGTLAAALMPVMMAVAVFPGWRPAGMVFAVFVALELIVSNFVEPMLYGVHTGISSLAILVAAVFWATLWGPVGLILSTPLTVCLIVLGRYVPQLKFLEVVLGDEPVLTGAQRFYQRLLARDREEAAAIAQTHLKEASLESVYDSMFVPALRLAEQDYEIDALDDETRRFVFRSTKDLIEDLGALAEEDALLALPEKKMVALPTNGSGARIACLAARSGPDDLVAMMVAQLLHHAGYNASEVTERRVEDALAAISQQEFGVACVSALTPFAAPQARTLCRRLQAANPRLQIVMGLWSVEEGDDKALERLGGNCAATVCLTLAQALSEIRKFAEVWEAPEPEPGQHSISA